VKIVVEILGEPCSQGRPRFARRGKFVVAYDPPKSRSWKAAAQYHMKYVMCDRPPLSGPLRVLITARFTCPKTDCRKRAPRPERWHAKKPDAENVAKAVLDAATGVVYLDDSQVAYLTVSKRIAAQGAAPAVILEVEELV
jgi:Holliday junction resolvase RusA-like endonuclease